jgi:hypothetical protein
VYIRVGESEEKDVGTIDEENLSKLKISLKLMKKLPKGVRYIRDIASLDVSKIGLSTEEQHSLNEFVGMVKKTFKMD